jgi:hypothetical protein
LQKDDENNTAKLPNLHFHFIKKRRKTNTFFLIDDTDRMQTSSATHYIVNIQDYR